MRPYAATQTTRNSLGMLHCEAILKGGGGSRVATIAETQEFVRFRTQKPHADNDERDGLRFYDTLTGLIPRHVNTLLSPSCMLLRTERFGNFDALRASEICVNFSVSECM